mmetsp:Transcript_7560/g.22171  ORF Transcript_7560/g.22171 Transcript_7560/m.22171 type:complete len:313 (+) Transcript_7560:194-1132(+)
MEKNSYNCSYLEELPLLLFSLFPFYSKASSNIGVCLHWCIRRGSCTIHARSSFDGLLHGSSGSGRLRLRCRGSCSSSSFPLLLRLQHRRCRHLLLGLHDGDHIIQRNLGPLQALRVVGEHDGHLDPNDSLPHEHVPNCDVGVHLAGMTSLDHVSITKLHGLSTLPAKLTSDNDLHTLGTGLHDKSNNTVARTTNSKSTKKLELKGLGLGLCAQATVLHALSIKLNGTIGEVEPLLDDRGELPDALTLLSENVLGAGGTDDDLGPVWGGTDLHSSVSILGQLTSEELVKLGVEDAVCDELPLGRHLGACGHHL